MNFNILEYSYFKSSGSLFQVLMRLDKNNLHGAEIGVRAGTNLVYLLENCNKIANIKAIDPYVPYQDGPFFVTQADQDLVKSIAIQSLEEKGLSDKVDFIFKFSDEAALEILDESLDFVFIDGDHSEEWARKDLETYFNKVKPGGVVSGHDWSLSNCLIGRIVTEFCQSRGLSAPNHIDSDAWYFIKQIKE